MSRRFVVGTGRVAAASWGERFAALSPLILELIVATRFMTPRSTCAYQLARVSGKSALAEAIRYALRHWPGLGLFLEDGRVELDTNTVERAIRPIALGRK